MRYPFRLIPLILAAAAGLTGLPLAHADSADACFNFLKAQDYPRAQAEARRLLKAKGLGRIEERSAQLCLGRALKNTGQFRAALAPLQRVEALSQSTEELAAAYNWLGLVHSSLGDLDRAELYDQRAVKAARELGDKSGEAANLNNLAEVVKKKGDVERALALYRQALDLEPYEAEKPSKLNNIAMIHSARGEYAEAARLLRQALVIERRHGNAHGVAMGQLNLGNILCQQGDLAAAEKELLAGLAAIQLIGDKDWEGAAYRYLGELGYTQGRLAEAKDLTRKAIEISRATGTVDQTAVRNLDFFNKQ